MPNFAHLPLLVNEQGLKLSKRRDDVAIDSFKVRHKPVIPMGDGADDSNGDTSPKRSSTSWRSLGGTTSLPWSIG
jgi:hypothetical protein